MILVINKAIRSLRYVVRRAPRIADNETFGCILSERGSLPHCSLELLRVVLDSLGDLSEKVGDLLLMTEILHDLIYIYMYMHTYLPVLYCHAGSISSTVAPSSRGAAEIISQVSTKLSSAHRNMGVSKN